MKFLWVIAAMLVTFSMLGCVIERTENAGLTTAERNAKNYTSYLDRQAAAIRRERQEQNDLQYHMLLQDIQRRAKQ